MSMRVEWGSAPYVGFEIQKQGEYPFDGEFTVDEEFAAVIGLDGGSGVVVEGSADDLEKMFTDALDALAKARKGK